MMMMVQRHTQGRNAFTRSHQTTKRNNGSTRAERRKGEVSGMSDVGLS